MHELACVFLSIFKRFYCSVSLFFEDDKINLILFLVCITFHEYLELSQVLNMS